MTPIWALTVEHLQSTVQEVEKALSMNGDKTQCICSVAQQGIVVVGGQTSRHRWPGQRRQGPGSEFFHWVVIIAYMQEKARAVWHANRHVFRAGGKCKDILALLDTLVRPAALWGCGTWPSHAAILQAAFTIQLRLLRDAKQLKRLRGRAGSCGINAPFEQPEHECISWGEDDGPHSF